jgi:hypothetical protein
VYYRAIWGKVQWGALALPVRSTYRQDIWIPGSRF